MLKPSTQVQVENQVSVFKGQFERVKINKQANKKQKTNKQKTRN